MMSKLLSTVRLLLEHGADVNMLIMPDGHSPLVLAVTALADWRRWGHEYRLYRTCVIELLQLTVKHGAQLHDSCCELRDDDYLQAANSCTLVALANFDGKDKFVVDLFRAGAGCRLLARCCIGVLLYWKAKFTGLCQAAVLAGYVPTAQ